jgi:Tol biopolymer transport system component
VVVVGLNDHGDASPPIMRVTPPADSGEVPCPEWSPDGDQVAFRIGSDLWVADAASGMTTGFPVAEAPWGQQGFEWSRDGSRVAVAEPGRIRVVRVDGVSATLIPVPGDTPSSLDWTAGDDRIIYIGNERSGDVLAVKVVGVDATNDTQLTLRGTAALQLWASDAVVSPDGTQVAFVQVTTRCVNDECGTDSTRILTMDTHGSNLTEVATPPDFGASGLQWSPDGERLLFGSGGGGVVSVPVAPGSPEIVLPNGELNLEYSASELTWQPVVP